MDKCGDCAGRSGAEQAGGGLCSWRRDLITRRPGRRDITRVRGALSWAQTSHCCRGGSGGSGNEAPVVRVPPRQSPRGWCSLPTGRAATAGLKLRRLPPLVVRGPGGPSEVTPRARWGWDGGDCFHLVFTLSVCCLLGWLWCF